MGERLLRSGALARHLSVDRRTVVNWWHAGAITPEYVTPYGEPRWSLSRVRADLAGRNDETPATPAE